MSTATAEKPKPRNIDELRRAMLQDPAIEQANPALVGELKEAVAERERKAAERKAKGRGGVPKAWKAVNKAYTPNRQYQGPEVWATWWQTALDLTALISRELPDAIKSRVTFYYSAWCEDPDGRFRVKPVIGVESHPVSACWIRVEGIPAADSAESPLSITDTQALHERLTALGMGVEQGTHTWTLTARPSADGQRVDYGPPKGQARGFGRELYEQAKAYESMQR